MIMSVDAYYVRQMRYLIRNLIDQSPPLNCLDCYKEDAQETMLTGHMKWDGFEFYYECSRCGSNWPPPLEVDTNGKILPLKQPPVAY